MASYSSTTNSAVPTETQSRNVVPPAQAASTEQLRGFLWAKHHTQDIREDAPSGQERQGVNQNAQKGGSTVSENDAEGQSQVRMITIMMEERSMSTKEHWGTAQHVKEQPDKGELGGLPASRLLARLTFITCNL